ncbi:MAG TPA: crossover junction endodeoxyribonuclease RuvC [Rickettsiales bacterium]|nr:crossover junction endodeoxyribonuclease RuvC [Rickettsiales bacterium]
MIIIGIDPGLIKTGWGIIEKINNEVKYVASGTIKTDTKLCLSERLLNIYKCVDCLIKTYKPEQFSIEETFVNKNPLSSLKLGHARGVAILAGALNNIPVFEYSPNLIKKTITGVGKAEKQQMVAMMKYIFPCVKLETEDEADALCIAVCHCNHINNF